MILVFDLGGTNTRMALADKGEIGEVIHVPTDRSAAGFAKFMGALQELAADNKISAVAGGMPGQLHGEDGEFLVATNLPEWKGLPVLKLLKELFGVPVFVANDVEMCGLGEAQFGAGLSEGVMAYYTVSTGVNGVRLVDGRIDPTIARYELGKQIVDHEKGVPQELETLISGAALERRLAAKPATIEDDRVWAAEEKYLASGLYNTALYWNPARIVLGGSMMRDVKISHVAAEMPKLPNVFDSWPELVAAKLGDEAGIRGCVAWLEIKGYR
ncbi:MAG: ROK family protein [Candidatus Saccharimonadales bacterium]